MKLLHITATHLNPEGGIPVVLNNLVIEQNKINDFEVRVLAIKKNVNRINNPYFFYEHNKEGIIRYIKDFKPDIVIIHSIYFFEYYFIYKILNNMKISYLVEPHGSFSRLAQKKSLWKKKFVNNTILRGFFKCAKGYLFLSELEQKDSIFRKNIELIIPNGISKVTKTVLNQKKSMNSNNTYIYFVGRFDIETKGMDLLFDAINILDKRKENIVIDLYGVGDDAQIEYINSRIDEFNYIKVTNKGPIYGEEKEQILRKYDIMVLTSRHEGFPMTVLESLSYGVPCIATSGANVSHIIMNNNVGIVTSQNPKDIANSIIKMKKNLENNSEEYIERCQNTIINQYMWKEIAKKSYNLLSELVN